MTHIPDFPNIETAAAWAEINQPLKRALNHWQSDKSEYGIKASAASQKLWLAINDDEPERETIRLMRNLSWSLPAHVWEDRRR